MHPIFYHFRKQYKFTERSTDSKKSAAKCWKATAWCVSTGKMGFQSPNCNSPLQFSFSSSSEGEFQGFRPFTSASEHSGQNISPSVVILSSGKAYFSVSVAPPKNEN